MIPIREIQSALRLASLDAWLFFDFRRSNQIAWDLLQLGGDEMITRRWFYLVPAHGEPVRVLHAIEGHCLPQLPGGIRTYSDWRSLRTALTDVFREAARVAMEYSPEGNIPTVSCVDAGTIEMVRSLGVDVVSSADLVQQFQATWTDAQIADNLVAARAMRALVEESFAFITDHLRSKTRITEFDVQQFLMTGYGRNGLTTEHHPICSVNANAAMPHYAPTAETHSVIQRGDVVLLDFWAKPAKPDGTYVDITWMAVADSAPSAEYASVFKVVAGARDAALDLVRSRFASQESVRGFEVDDASRAVIAKAGYGEYFIHRTGHSIHTEDHGRGANMDNYETHDERQILPRTSFSIEPGIYLPRRFGVRSEIDVLITSDSRVVIPCAPIQPEIIRLLP
jgi:Xaa-Pro dipeptidase